MTRIPMGKWPFAADAPGAAPTIGRDTRRLRDRY